MSASSRLSILVVEDNEDGAHTMAVLLDIYGHSFRSATVGDITLRMARESPPDVVFLDIGLPRMDGCEFAEQLLRVLAHRPLLIAVTGYTHMEKRCRKVGFDHYFVKPFEPKVFEDLRRQHTEKRD